MTDTHCRHMAGVHLDGVGPCRVAGCGCQGIPGAKARPTIPSDALAKIAVEANLGRVVIVYPAANVTVGELQLSMVKAGLGLARDDELVWTAIAWIPEGMNAVAQPEPNQPEEPTGKEPS